jgi:F-type H+-transporting ATPase subunit b
VQLNWFTLVAQIVNFLILLYLLKRFLYGPVIDMMDKREQKIAARLQEAEEKHNEAEQQAERYRQQRRELEEERGERLTAIQEEVEARRKDLLKEAHEEVQKKKQDWQEALQREQDAFMQELRQRLGREATEVARRALQDLADVQVEQRMADLFVTRIQELDPTERDEISESIQESDGKIVIRSTFELPEEMQQRITDAVQSQIMDEGGLDARFETSPDLISGIEMQVDGYQVAWTIRDYLDHLEQQIRRAIEHESQEKNENGAGS